MEKFRTYGRRSTNPLCALKWAARGKRRTIPPLTTQVPIQSRHLPANSRQKKTRRATPNEKDRSTVSTVGIPSLLQSIPCLEYDPVLRSHAKLLLTDQPENHT